MLSTAKYYCLLLAFFLSCHEKPKEKPIAKIVSKAEIAAKNTLKLYDTTNKFWALQTITKPFPKPQDGDWQAVHKESGQTFIDYLNCNPRIVDEVRRKIYLLPLGNFSKKDDILLLQMTKDYMAIFFDVEVIVQKTQSLKIIPKKSRRYEGKGQQIQTGYILYQILEKSLPKDAIAYMAITTADLFPSEEWSFVFGIANTQKRIAVTSLYRFKSYNGDLLDIPLSFNRLAQTSIHETGHMFSILHCIYFDCIMNGSNSLAESDSQSLFPCPICTAKLDVAISANMTKKYKAMQLFFEKYGMKKEAKYCKKAKTLLK